MNITQVALLALTVFSYAAQAENRAQLSQVEDRIELKTSFIKGNKELPQVLYIVPWQKLKKTKHKQGKMVLHSLYGNIFQPVTLKDLTE